MAHEPEAVLFALKKVDQGKRFVLTMVVVLFVVVLFTFGVLLAHTRVADGGQSKLMFAATAAQMAFVGICAVLVAFHVTRMAKTVVNAIELASKK